MLPPPARRCRSENQIAITDIADYEGHVTRQGQALAGPKIVEDHDLKVHFPQGQYSRPPVRRMVSQDLMV